MKKTIILFAVVAIAALGSCKRGSSNLKTEHDSLSYALGLDLGNYVKSTDSTLKVNVMARAISDVIANKPKMTQEDAYAFLREYFTVRKPAKAKAESEEFLAGIEKNNKNVKKTESGLLYEIVAEGGEKATSAMDTVVVNYKGTLPNGTTFDSSYDRGEPATFPLNNVIAGWTEGIMLVGKGGKINLWIPSDLAYGASQNGPIGPNQALAFEIEVIDVKPAVAAPAN